MSEIREVCSELKLKQVAVQTTENKLVIENSALITQLTPANEVKTVDNADGLRLSGAQQHLWLELSNNQIKAYKASLQTKLEQLQKSIQHLSGRLSNESYIANAPEVLVEESRHDLDHKNNQVKHLQHQLNRL